MSKPLLLFKVLKINQTWRAHLLSSILLSSWHSINCNCWFSLFLTHHQVRNLHIVLQQCWNEGEHYFDTVEIKFLSLQYLSQDWVFHLFYLNRQFESYNFVKKIHCKGCLKRAFPCNNIFPNWKQRKKNRTRKFRKYV